MTEPAVVPTPSANGLGPTEGMGPDGPAGEYGALPDRREGSGRSRPPGPGQAYDDLDSDLWDALLQAFKTYVESPPPDPRDGAT